MTTHSWEEVDQIMQWCSVCGTLNTGVFRVVGSEYVLTEEPPCAGWQWQDFMSPGFLEEPRILHAAKLVTPDRLPLPPVGEPRFANLDIGELDLHQDQFGYETRASLTINRRLQIFDVAISSIYNSTVTFSNVGLFPGMSLEFRCDLPVSDYVLQLLVRNVASDIDSRGNNRRWT